MNQSKILNITGLVYLVLMFIVFPLFFTDYYYNIQESKSLFFRVITIAVFIWILIQYLFFIFKNKSGINMNLLNPDNRYESVLNVLLFGSLFGFAVWSLIATFQGAEVQAAFTGSYGRFIGWWWILACCMAFLICCCVKSKIKEISCFLFIAGASAVIMIGYCHQLGVNIGDFLTHVPDVYTGMYLSTIGYINFFSQYASFAVIIITGLYCVRGDHYLLPFVGLADLGLLLGNSDGGLLGAIAAFLFFPVLLIHNREQLLRLTECLLVLPFVCLIYRFLQPFLIGNNAITAIAVILMKPAVIALMIVSCTILYLFLKRYKTGSPALHAKYLFFRRIYGIVLITCIGITVLVFSLSLIHVLNTGIFSIDDSWGSNRGFIWRKLLEVFRDSSITRKIFGWGPDSIRTIANNLFYEEMMNTTHQIYDSAHNDIIQYLLTIGIPGVLIYICFWTTSVLKAIRSTSPCSRVFLMGMTCYLIQSLVVPVQPMTTPFAFLFAGLAMEFPAVKKENQQ